MTIAQAILDDRAAELRAMCERFGVRKLEIFGSATTAGFDSQRSDLDFLVEFTDASAQDAADNYFGLMTSLEDLFGRKVDLVFADAIRNPYFLQKINTQRRVLYAA